MKTIQRRGFLGLVGAGVLTFAGCLKPPSSSPPPYETREIDDGAVYTPGLREGPSMDFFADLVTADSEARAFDLQTVPRQSDRTFIEATDYDRSYLGVVQVSGLNSSMAIRLVDMAETTEQLGLVLDLEDEPPHSDDWVITTFLVRVRREGQPPDRIWVELSIGDRTVDFSSD